MANSINAFEMAQRQFDHVAGLLKLDPQVAEILRWPLREFHFRIPVRMDDGSIRVFHNFKSRVTDQVICDVDILVIIGIPSIDFPSESLPEICFCFLKIFDSDTDMVNIICFQLFRHFSSLFSGALDPTDIKGFVPG